MKTTTKASKARLVVGAVVAGALVAGLSASPAFGVTAEDDPVADILAEPGFLLAELISESRAIPIGRGVLTYTAALMFTPGEKQPKVSDVAVTMRAVDFDGATVGAERVITDAVTLGKGRAGKAAGVDCAWRGPKQHEVTTFAPQRTQVRTEIGTLNLASAFARAPHTADVVGQPTEAQWVGCAAGGAKLVGGFRIIETGGGAAYREAKESAKFGMAWRNGAAPKRYQLRSGFPVAYEKTGAMVGSVRQIPGGQLLGSFSAPVRTAASDFDRNASYSYWQDPCLDSPACPGAQGSRGFQGATAHAVWALPGEGPRTFVVAGYVHYACADPAAAACT